MESSCILTQERLMKKIYRIKKEKKIAGICAGIGEIYGWDPTIVRVVAVFGAVATGIWPGVIAYCAGWYLIPDKEDVETGKGNFKDSIN
jgi:phage shock protein C